MLKVLKILEERFKKETDSYLGEEYVRIKAINKIKEMQSLVRISEDSCITPILELSNYPYEELEEILNMPLITKAIYYSGYFVDEDLERYISENNSERIWEYRLENQFNLYPSSFMLRVEDKDECQVFTEEFCRDLIWELIKAEFIIETDLIAAREQTSIEEAIEVYKSNLIEIVEGQHFGSSKIYTWRDNLQAVKGDILKVPTRRGDTLIRVFNAYKVGQLFSYDMKTTEKKVWI